MTYESVMNIGRDVVTSAGNEAGALAHNLSQMQVPGAKAQEVFRVTRMQGADRGGGAEMNVVTRNSVQGGIGKGKGPMDTAIEGKGFFPSVKDLGDLDTGKVVGTRNGTFGVQADDTLLKNQANEILLVRDLRGGVDVNANVTIADLKPFNMSSLGGMASASTAVSISANLPSSVANGVIPEATTITSYDNLGGKHNIGVSWEKTNANEWKATILDKGTPDTPIDPATVIQEVELKFTDGQLSEVDGSTVSGKVNTTFVYNGANQDIEFNFGAIGTTSGLRQFDHQFVLDDSRQTGGRAYSFVREFKFDEQGAGVVRYDNGFKETVCQLYLLTSVAPDALATTDGGSRETTFDSGPWGVALPGTGAGKIREGVELATYGVTEQFTDLTKVSEAHQAGLSLIKKAADLKELTVAKLGS